MRKLIYFPFYVFLLSVYPTLFLYTENLSYITFGEFLECALFFSGLAAVLFFLVYAWCSDLTRTGLFLGLIFIAVAAYAPISNLLYLLFVLGGFEFPLFDVVVAVGFLMVLVVLGMKITKGKFDPKINTLLNTFALVLVVLCGLNLISEQVEDFWASNSIEKRLHQRALELAGTSDVSSDQLPSIMYLILDGYGRSDVLEQMYGLELSSFTSYLTEQGFTIASESRSNYIQTFLSLASSLNLGYLDDLLAEVKPTSVNRAVLQRILRENILFRKLKDLGYHVITVSTGFDTTAEVNVDQRVKDPSVNTLFGALLTNLHVPYMRQHISTWLHRAHYERVLYGLEFLKQLPRTNDPTFVFAHILAPHPPFVFSSDGSFRAPAKDYALADGDDYGPRETYRQGYADQVRFLNGKLEELIRSFKRNTARPLIIILQGDHGPGSQLQWESVERSNLKERFSILNAIYFSDPLQSKLPSTLTPANTFRIIANRYFGSKLEMLPNRHLFSSTHRPYQMVEVGQIP